MSIFDFLPKKRLSDLDRVASADADDLVLVETPGGSDAKAIKVKNLLKDTVYATKEEAEQGIRQEISTDPARVKDAIHYRAPRRLDRLESSGEREEIAPLHAGIVRQGVPNTPSIVLKAQDEDSEWTHVSKGGEFGAEFSFEAVEPNDTTKINILASRDGFDLSGSSTKGSWNQNVRIKKLSTSDLDLPPNQNVVGMTPALTRHMLDSAEFEIPRFATKAEAELGSREDLVMNPARTVDAIKKHSPPPTYATKAEAEEGVITNKVMSPATVLDAIIKNAPEIPEVVYATEQEAREGLLNDVGMTPLRAREAIESLGLPFDPATFGLPSDTPNPGGGWIEATVGASTHAGIRLGSIGIAAGVMGEGNEVAGQEPYISFGDMGSNEVRITTGKTDSPEVPRVFSLQKGQHKVEFAHLTEQNVEDYRAEDVIGMTPSLTKYLIENTVEDVVFASEQEAREGIEDGVAMSPVRTKQAIESLGVYNANYLMDPTHEGYVGATSIGFEGADAGITFVATKTLIDDPDAELEEATLFAVMTSLDSSAIYLGGATGEEELSTLQISAEEGSFYLGADGIKDDNSGTWYHDLELANLTEEDLDDPEKQNIIGMTPALTQYMIDESLDDVGGESLWEDLSTLWGVPKGHQGVAAGRFGYGHRASLILAGSPDAWGEGYNVSAMYGGGDDFAELSVESSDEDGEGIAGFTLAATPRGFFLTAYDVTHVHLSNLTEQDLDDSEKKDVVGMTPALTQYMIDEYAPPEIIFNTDITLGEAHNGALLIASGGDSTVTCDQVGEGFTCTVLRWDSEVFFKDADLYETGLNLLVTDGRAAVVTGTSKGVWVTGCDGERG